MTAEFAKEFGLTPAQLAGLTHPALHEILSDERNRPNRSSDEIKKLSACITLTQAGIRATTVAKLLAASELDVDETLASEHALLCKVKENTTEAIAQTARLELELKSGKIPEVGALVELGCRIREIDKILSNSE
jgi:hypothetical protein